MDANKAAKVYQKMTPNRRMAFSAGITSNDIGLFAFALGGLWVADKIELAVVKQHKPVLEETEEQKRQRKAMERELE